MSYLSASAVVIHYEDTLYQVYAPLAGFFFLAKAKQTSSEARQADSGGGVLGEGQPPHQLVSGESCKGDRTPATKRFSHVLGVQSGFSRQFCSLVLVITLCAKLCSVL